MQSRSFFGELQGWFKKEYGVEYGGRYMGLLMEHSSRADPVPFRKFLAGLLGPTFGDASVALSREYVFPGRTGFRRADLAVQIENEVRVLIELKYRDRLMQPSGPKPAQLDDYLRYCKANPRCRFLLLHREPQKSVDLIKITTAGQCLAHYTVLAPYLRNSDHQASSMLYEYLQEEGLVLEPINSDYLNRFLHRIMLPGRNSGRVNITSKIGEGPRQFQALLNNMRLFAADVTPQLKRVTGKENARAATVDFEVLNRFNSQKVRKAAEDSRNSKHFWINASERSGGRLGVWAHNAFSDHRRHWLYVSYGFEFVVEPGVFRCEQYAGLDSPELDRVDKHDIYVVEPFHLRRFSDLEKAKIDMTFIDLIRHTAKKTLKERLVKEPFARKLIQGLATL